MEEGSTWQKLELWRERLSCKSWRLGGAIASSTAPGRERGGETLWPSLSPTSASHWPNLAGSQLTSDPGISPLQELVAVVHSKELQGSESKHACFLHRLCARNSGHKNRIRQSQPEGIHSYTNSYSAVW